MLDCTGLYDYLDPYYRPYFSDFKGMADNYRPFDDRIACGSISFIRKDYDIDNHYQNSDGWKIHLSIDSSDGGRNLRRAVDNVIAPILMKANVGAVKIFIATAKTSAKAVTIYGSGNESWGSIARKLENGLTEWQINPGPRIPGDRMVKGSRYIGYRNERSFHLDRYLDHRDPEYIPGYIYAHDILRLIGEGKVPSGLEYNPAQQPDTLKDIDFTPKVIPAITPLRDDVMPTHQRPTRQIVADDRKLWSPDKSKDEGIA